MTGETSYTGSRSQPYVTSPPTLPSRHHNPSSSGPSPPSSYSSHPISAPPQASIHPGPGSRRRSDYVEQHNQPYSGYSSPPAPASRASIDYPRPHSLGAGSLVKPPPPAQGHGMERYDMRPGVVRSGSIRGLDLVAREGDEVAYWNDVALGLTGLKNLGKCVILLPSIPALANIGAVHVI
jgi:ubiquitin carboxyl-terminal hydrolase 8